MRAIAAVAALCLAACTPGFESASDVKDLRVLAVEADPPEAQFDATTADPIDVQVLAVDPGDPSAMTLHAAICAPTDSRRCDEGPSLDLGIQPLHTTLLVPPEFVRAAQQQDDLKGLGGIRVQYSFRVDHGDATRAVYGSKVLVYSPRGGTPNHNPLLTGVQLSRSGEAAGQVDAGNPIPLPKDVEIGLRPLLADGSIEQYETTDLRGNTVSLREYLRYSFFVGPGAEVDRDSADEPVNNAAPPDGLVRVTLHTSPATLWIVVRDGRGGESWVEFRLDEAL